MNEHSHDARIVVLVFVKHYLPGHKAGGPIRAIANMVEQLSADFEFRIVTNDRDAGDATPYPGVAYDRWNAVGKAKVYYVSASKLRWWYMARILSKTSHDVLYVNSYFDPNFTLLPLVARRLRVVPRRAAVVAPRGEFASDALKIKRVRKNIFMGLTKLTGIFRDVLWHASTKEEEADLRAELGEDVEVEVATDVFPVRIDPGRLDADGWREDAELPLKVVFLSRVSPMKNLCFLVEVLSRVSVRVQCDIFGVIDDPEYWNDVRRSIAVLPANVRMTYVGDLPHEKVHSTLARYDLFFLPTRGESYGHAIREALEAGTPVLISNRTPWRDLEGQGVGWDLPLDSHEPFMEVIERLANESGAERSRQRFACRKYADDVRAESSSVEDHKLLFSKAASRTLRGTPM